jgi:hypothetical protein
MIFRYQYEYYASGQQQTAKVYFLSVRTVDDSTGYWINGDPSEALLAHFSENVSLVPQFSSCTLSTAGVFDKETGERGLLFDISEIRWISDAKAEADGGYFEAGLSASGNTYYLEYIDGQWTVTRSGIDDRDKILSIYKQINCFIYK